MNAVKIHGIVLAVVLVAAYQTWTRDESNTDESEGATTVWNRRVDDLKSITYVNAGGTLVVERRTDSASASGESYLWGVFTPNPSAPDSTDTSTEAAPAAPVAIQFPVGDEGDDLFRRLASLRALRELGDMGDKTREEYELTAPERSLTMRFADGDRTLEFGGTVFGAPHRYALDPSTGRGYVISNDVIRAVEDGGTALRSKQLHEYPLSDVTSISVRTPSTQKQMVRQGPARAATWTNPDNPGEADQTFANFVQRVEQLAVAGYDASVNLDTLQLVVRIDYADARQRPLGFLEMFRGPENAVGSSEFYLRTEATRIAGLAYHGVAERVASDLPDIF